MGAEFAEKVPRCPATAGANALAGAAIAIKQLFDDVRVRRRLKRFKARRVDGSRLALGKPLSDGCKVLV